MTDFDRKLADLIATLTDEGQVWPLDLALHEYGPELTARILADGFAVVRAVPYADFDDDNLLPVEDAVVLLHHLRKTDDYIVAAGPWAAICLEDEPNLIFSYAANEPKAVAEVRSRHAQRREAWERRHR